MAPLRERLIQLRREDPERYRDLWRRYTEAFLAVEQDGVDRIEDAVDNDVEEQIFALLEELESRR